MTHTALDLITASLKRLGVLSGIETPAADLAQDGLDRLNSLIETWSTEALTVWYRSALIVPLVDGQEAYGLGPTGDVPIRPERVDGVNLIVVGSPYYEVPLQRLDDDEWRRLTIKGLMAVWPTHFYYNPTYPAGQLRLWPIYSGGTVPSVAVYCLSPLLSVPLLTTVLDLPAGYYRALRDWLAIELAPEVGRPVDGTLVQSATDAKAQLQRVNFHPRELLLPAALGGLCGGGYDWRTDE